MKIGIIPSAAMAFALSGCVAALPIVAAEGGGVGLARMVGVSSSKGNMARATALALGKNINPDSIKISDAHVGIHEARWVADTPMGRYDCSDNDGVTGPAYCAAKR